jgi:hypothetical protein
MGVCFMLDRDLSQCCVLPLLTVILPKVHSTLELRLADYWLLHHGIASNGAVMRMVNLRAWERKHSWLSQDYTQ